MIFPLRAEPTALVFLTRPPPAFVDKFVNHLRETNQPEDFPGLSQDRITDLGDSEILREFQVDRKKRLDGSAVACPVCSPTSPKFLKGFLVWNPETGAVSVIGHECGKGIHNNWERAKRQHEERKKDRLREEFLFENLANVPEMLLDLRKIKAELEIAERVWKDIQKQMPQIKAIIRDAASHGPLTADVQAIRDKSIRQSNSELSKYKTVSFGLVDGQEVVARRFFDVSKIEILIQQLDAIDCGDSKEATGLMVCEMLKREMIAAENIIRTGVRTTASTSDWLARFKSFFSHKNIKRIDDWIHTPYSAVPTGTEIKRYIHHLVLICPEYGDAKIDICELAP